MTTVWKISPDRSTSASYEESWQACREQKCMAIGWAALKDLRKFKSKEEIFRALQKIHDGGWRAATQLWQFCREIEPLHIVVASKGTQKVVGIGVVKSDYLPPGPNSPTKSQWATHARTVDWEVTKEVDLGEKEFFGRVPVTVSKLESDKCRRIKMAYLSAYPTDLTLRETLDRLLPDEDSANSGRKGVSMASISPLLKEFGQIILYGPPGTGKTREAKLAALALFNKRARDDVTEGELKEKLSPFQEKGRLKLVVFHPAYEYEQFVGGIAPNFTNGNGGFEPTPGAFLTLCRAAAAMPGEPFVLVIDEINRGNLPKLLGELVYALEYRGEPVALPFAFDDDCTLTIPENLYIVATMNSADRSIGHIDVAIRRRFGLVECQPRPKVVTDIWASIGEADYGVKLAKLMDQLNELLKNNSHDATATIEVGVGHSYFLPKGDAIGDTAKQQVRNKWKYQVKPLLREYEQLVPSADSLQEYLLSESLDECFD